MDKIPVSKLVGEALVVDLSDKPIGSGITDTDLKMKLEGKVQQNDMVLLYTGSSDLWGDPSVNSNYTYLSKEAAEYLVSKRVRAVGIDFLSVEKFKAPEPVAHRTLLGNGIFIIESLSSELKQFADQRILLITFPIKLENGDGAPTRSVAIPISNED